MDQIKNGPNVDIQFLQLGSSGLHPLVWGPSVSIFEWRYICSNKTNNRIAFSNDKWNEIQPLRRYMNLDSTFKPFLQVKTSNQWLLQSDNTSTRVYCLIKPRILPLPHFWSL